jgi:hypothetical protein
MQWSIVFPKKSQTKKWIAISIINCNGHHHHQQHKQRRKKTRFMAMITTYCTVTAEADLFFAPTAFMPVPSWEGRSKEESQSRSCFSVACV